MPDYFPDSTTGVPLAHYREHGANLLLTCLNCMLSRVFDLERVIARLQEKGLGGAETGIKAVAAFVIEACPRCGHRHYDSAPAWPQSTAKTD